MKFRDYEVDDIIVIGPYVEKLFREQLKVLHQRYIVIDLQYAVIKEHNLVGHSALALVRNKDD